MRGGRITVSVPEDPEAAGTDSSREGRGAAKLAVCVSPPAQRGRDAPGVMGVQADAVREAVSRAWGELRLPGVHNGRNAAVAAATACLFGAGSADVAAAAASFPGLPQRLQTVGHVAGVPVIDDSASTTIESTLAALRALGEGCVLICGGTSKGADPRPLVAAFTRCRAVATIGPAGTELVRLWNGIRRNAGVSPSPAVSDVKPQVADCGTLDRAVRWALKQAPGSRALLFSPAFSSFHAYRNYAERGAHFLECVRRYIGGDGASGRHAGSA
ncbi:MAG: hypothetical protein D6725_09620 [Planctomycetota bacterium]|nr:MAG: hypothetical protein D6725_09620 [Planctomycetota bacterium]